MNHIAFGKRQAHRNQCGFKVLDHHGRDIIVPIFGGVFSTEYRKLRDGLRAAGYNPKMISWSTDDIMTGAATVPGTLYVGYTRN